MVMVITTMIALKTAMMAIIQTLAIASLAQFSLHSGVERIKEALELKQCFATRLFVRLGSPHESQDQSLHELLDLTRWHSSSHGCLQSCAILLVLTTGVPQCSGMLGFELIGDTDVVSRAVSETFFPICCCGRFLFPCILKPVHYIQPVLGIVKLAKFVHIEMLSVGEPGYGSVTVGKQSADKRLVNFAFWKSFKHERQ